MTDTDATYETPDDIAAETAERAACADTDNPVAPVDPFEPGSLGWLLPWAETGEGDVLSPDEALEVFLEWVEARGMELWPHQEDALMDLAVGDSVILGTPTGSGKSMVALGLCFMAIATGRTAYYTAPIKALVSEKFFDMVEVLGRDNVGMITGDSTINTEAPVICCTAEILANQALREGAASKVACVVMDEFHFYADPDRGWAWQVPLLTLTNAQFLLMSATLGDVTDIAALVEERTARTVDLVTDAPRPVPLSYEYTLETLEATVELGLRAGEAPMYIVHFSQDEALKNARALASYGVADKEQREAVKAAMKGTKFTTPFGKILQRRGRAPRGDAAALPPARGTSGPAGAAAGHLRHRHLGRGHQRAHPHGGAHPAHQVRRHQDAPPALARVPPDRGPCGTVGLRHRGHGGGARPRARD